jgi:hypothetical protein
LSLLSTEKAEKAQYTEGLGSGETDGKTRFGGGPSAAVAGPAVMLSPASGSSTLPPSTPAHGHHGSMSSTTTASTPAPATGATPWTVAPHQNLPSIDQKQDSLDGVARDIWATCGDTGTGVPWTIFERQLLLYFSEATGATRQLGREDVHHMRAMVAQLSGIGSAEVVTRDMFAKFWEWFGGCIGIVYKIRDIWSSVTPHVLIHGILSRDTATALVKGQPAGSFLLRMSGTVAGCIAVDFVDPDGVNISHTLIRPQPVG